MTSPREQARSSSRRDDLQREKSKNKTFQQKVDSFAYSLFGDWFSERRHDFTDLQRTLDEAQYGMSVDLFLSRMTLYVIVFGTLGVLFGAGIGIALHVLGVLSSIHLPPIFPHGSIPVASFIREYKFVLQLGVIGTVFFAVFGLFTFGGVFAWPKFQASSRRRKIDRTLPYSVTFMYALSRGGMNFIDVLKTLADAEETYGEVSREIQPIIKDLEYFSRDLPRAMHDAGRRSPSGKFEAFTDDLVGVIDTGADLTSFLEDKSEQYLDEAEHEQEQFIDFLELLGEVYVTAFVAGPLFLIIITVVMSMLGGTSIKQLYGIVYVLLPIMNLLFYLFVDTISPDDGGTAATLPTHSDARSIEELQELAEEGDMDSEAIKQVINAKKKRERNDLLQDPIGETLRNPAYTFGITVPVALAILGLVVGTGFVDLSMAGLSTHPVSITFFAGILPLLVVIVPFSLFHEIHAYRENKMMNRMPDALKQLASNNAVGMTLEESLQAAAENTGGRLGAEFRKVRNDIEWKHDINGALVGFANRVKSQMLARTIKLITEANSSTGDIEDVLEVAAKDVATRQRLAKQQKSALRMYTAVILISFAVYLFVIAVLDAAFLSQLAKLSGSGAANASSGAASSVSPGGGSGGGMGGMSLSDLPVDKFRMVFYHSTAVQALASGMLAGVLGSGDAKSGLKFSAILIIIATAVFWVLGTFL